jgi:hypothetical protein
VLPLYQHTDEQRIVRMLRALADPHGDPKIKSQVDVQVREWRMNPFEPHRIARLRLAAYQKTVVMKYIDNLIAWGDQLFSQGAGQGKIELINEATQLYILAQNILGTRPERLPERELPAEEIWVEDDLPDGATPIHRRGSPGGEPWTWVTNEPTPFSGSRAHQSGITTNIHGHGYRFENVGDAWRVEDGDKLFAYVYLDPDNLPELVVLTWWTQRNSNWYEHRAYWGPKDLSSDDIESLPEEVLDRLWGHRNFGPLPPAGEWVRLEVPPKQLRLEDQDVRGMSFTLRGGRATWDHVGRRVEPRTYSQLQSKLDTFSNALVKLENEFSLGGATSPNGGGSGANSLLKVGTSLYFCIPQNDQLLRYWDMVADRLFKIRHCQNIEGVAYRLPLFESPIEPGLLVRARAAGIDPSSALGDISSPLPHYRFGHMLQKALELCAELKSLGGALLSALEKTDAEALSNLRASNETAVLKAVRSIKEQQLEEATTALEGLHKTKEVTETRHRFYERSLADGMNPFEIVNLSLTGSSLFAQGVGLALDMVAGASHLFPDATAGVSGIASPVVTAKYGGANLGNAATSWADVAKAGASILGTGASMSATMGSFQRRADEWEHQEQVTAKELEQIDKQILAAEIRASIAQRDLDNHDKQIKASEEVEAFLREKYTNQELYDWTISQVSSVFFQTYRLAYDVAKRSERAYRFELGLGESNFIQGSYWGSLKRGLLSGEQLYLDLKRLEMAYLDQNRREYEITKHISLVLHDPLALIALKETGHCSVSLPEALFDMDYPGHYIRRIKSVSLTIPAVIGPYTSINCTLTLLKNKVRVDNNAEDDYKEDDHQDDRFIYDFGTVQSIATSHAQNDSGMFELNFRDERYLPFEGAGAVSEWRIDMPKVTNAFDFDTISDVILRINYSAREGGDLLRRKAMEAAQLPQPPKQETPGVVAALPAQENLRRLFSAKHEFFDEWNRFLKPADTSVEAESTLLLEIRPERLPFRFRGRKITINEVDLFLSLKDTHKPDDAEGRTYSQVYAAGTPLSVTVTPSPDGNRELRSDPALGGMPDATGVNVGGIDVGSADQPALQLSIKSVDIAAWAGGLEDLFIVCHYSVSSL